MPTFIATALVKLGPVIGKALADAFKQTPTDLDQIANPNLTVQQTIDILKGLNRLNRVANFYNQPLKNTGLTIEQGIAKLVIASHSRQYIADLLKNGSGDITGTMQVEFKKTLTMIEPLGIWQQLEGNTVPEAIDTNGIGIFQGQEVKPFAQNGLVAVPQNTSGLGVFNAVNPLDAIVKIGTSLLSASSTQGKQTVTQVPSGYYEAQKQYNASPMTAPANQIKASALDVNYSGGQLTVGEKDNTLLYLMGALGISKLLKLW